MRVVPGKVDSEPGMAGLHGRSILLCRPCMMLAIDGANFPIGRY